LAVPPGPVAFATYVVDSEGRTVRLPEGSTVPTPLSITTLVALEEFQERFVELPFSIAAGETLNGAAIINAKETNVGFDLRIAASPSLLLRFNPKFQ
jgi:hypothetical protein